MHTEWSHCVCGTLRHPSSSMLSCLSTLSMDFCWHSIQLYEYTTDTYTYMLFTSVDCVWQTKRIDSKCRLIHSTTVVRVCVRFRICTGNRLFFFFDSPHVSVEVDKSPVTWGERVFWSIQFINSYQFVRSPLKELSRYQT